MASKNETDSGVATDKANDKLTHSQGGVTTRDDATDVGVPMLAGDPSEPVGPEDALGVGPKRGDYHQRIGPDNYQPHESVPVPNVAVGTAGEPVSRVVAQRPRVDEVGDEAGKKGGVQTG